MKRLLQFLAGLTALAAALLLYAYAGERPQMRLQRYRLRLPGGVGAGLRILHLSDQHFGGDDWVRRRRLRQTRRLLQGLKPDLILCTGDFLHNDAGLDAVETLLQMLPPAPLGCYAVFGNHDYVQYSWRDFALNALRQITGADSWTGWLRALARQAWQMLALLARIWRNDRLRFARVPNNITELRALLDLYDLTLLENEARRLPGESGLWLVGMDDPVEGSGDLEEALATLPAGAPALFVTHNPDPAFDLPPGRAALTLAGHTHGGQVVLPWLGAIHTQGTQLPRRQPAGLIQRPGHAPLIVSRGMGESTPLRFRCPPEIVLIDLLPADPAS